MIDIGPQRQGRAATKGFKFPQRAGSQPRPHKPTVRRSLPLAGARSFPLARVESGRSQVHACLPHKNAQGVLNEP